MNPSRERALEWERRWALPTALATFAAVALLIASAIAISDVNGSGDAELLRSAHEHSSSLRLASVLEAIGFVLLVAPLLYLFRAVAARSDRVRTQLVGLVIAAPLFFAVSAVLNAAATDEAADQFVAGEAKSTLTAREAGTDCRSDLQDLGAEEFGEEFDGKGSGPAAAVSDCTATKVADEEASNALSEASTRGLATGFGLGGRLGLAIALFYSCLYAMRTGLLSRFWGSLGMALGVAALLLLVQFSVIWFIYFGLLLLGWVPGGKPPAWAAGKAIPWPTPGERAAADLQPPEPALGDGEPGGERRKRKQRD
jgi:hypothetical protein